MSFAEKIPRAWYFRPSCFLLEVRSAGKFENFSMFRRFFFFRGGMMNVRKAVCRKGCIVVSEGCCSFTRSPFLAVGEMVIIV